MQTFLLALAVIFGIVTVFLKSTNRVGIVTTVFKVLTTISLFVAAMQSFKVSQSDRVILMVALGLLFGAFGDFFMEWEKTFIHGMLAFLLGHMFYISGFLEMGSRPSWIFAVFLLLFGLSYFLFIQNSLGRERIPVLIYVIVISLMVIFASSTNSPAFPGAILFFISDMLLAYDKYVKRLPNRDFLVLTTYFVGQFLIALSVV
ncbi:lysoplasmalogenase [Fervidobacterium sp.]